MKTGTVYHADRPSFMVEPPADILHGLVTGAYIPVAQIEGADLEAIYALSQNLDAPWIENKGVFLTKPGIALAEKNAKHNGGRAGLRSTSVGDLVLTDENKLYVVSPIGHKELTIVIAKTI